MSSHREAPESSKDPAADNTDVYAFVSPDAPGFVTLIANFIPFQIPQGGPNFAEFADEVLYTINVSNTSGANPDISLEFRFTTHLSNQGNFLYNVGPIKSLHDKTYDNWSRKQTYTVTYNRGSNSKILGKDIKCPPVNVGPRSTPNYKKLVSEAIFENKASGVKLFAGQRAEGFYVDLGSIFDLAGLRPDNAFHAILPLAAEPGVNGTQDLNVHSIAVQLPISMLTASGSATPDATTPDAVIGVWATARRQAARVFNPNKGTWDNSGTRKQVSRLGNPLINEVINATAQKDKWNASPPSGDSAYQANYKNPGLAAAIAGLYPKAFPNLAAYVAAGKERTDIEVILGYGIPTAAGLGFQNQVGDGKTFADMLRLNMAIPATTDPAKIMPGGLLDGDAAGFPNGRRVFDNVTAIELQALAGRTIKIVDPSYTPDAASLKLSDGSTYTNGKEGGFMGYLPTFPYLGTPAGGYESKPGTPNAEPVTPAS